jgi:hypothetical protein
MSYTDSINLDSFRESRHEHITENALKRFYKYVIQLKDSSALGALDLMELLLKYGDNMLAVDYFFAFIVVNH